MKQILVIHSSPRGNASASRQGTAELLALLQQQLGAVKLVTRDLSEDPLPHVGSEQIAAYFTPAERRTTENIKAIELSDEAVDELLASDVVVIAAPVWNFSIPSSLKAWIDHVARAGRTFSYSASGPKGLVEGKRAYLVLASGGVFSEGPYQKMDFAEPYLRAVLGFIGINDVRTIRLEGLSDPKALGRVIEIAREQFKKAA